MRRRSATCALLLFMLLAVAGATAGCSRGNKAVGPAAADITGIVWQVTAAGDGAGSLLVVGLQGVPSAYDRASVRITQDTRWVLPSGSGDAAPLTSALAGRRVAVTFTGPVAESYPVQATAAVVRVLDPLGVSMHLTPAGIPQIEGTAVELVRDESGAVTALVVRPATTSDETRRVAVTSGTSWLLATPTEFKSAPATPLIGNGLEPTVHVRLQNDAAQWIAVTLPQ
jgi:hypothetical protein